MRRSVRHEMMKKWKTDSNEINKIEQSRLFSFIFICRKTSKQQRNTCFCYFLLYAEKMKEKQNWDGRAAFCWTAWPLVKKTNCVCRFICLKKKRLKDRRSMDENCHCLWNLFCSLLFWICDNHGDFAENVRNALHKNRNQEKKGTTSVASCTWLEKMAGRPHKVSDDFIRFVHSALGRPPHFIRQSVVLLDDATLTVLIATTTVMDCWWEIHMKQEGKRNREWNKQRNQCLFII